MQYQKNNTMIKCICPNCGICFKETPSLQNPNIYILECQKCGWKMEELKSIYKKHINTTHYE